MALVDVIDTTLREGQASPIMFDSYKYSFGVEERKKIIGGLMELGGRHFELYSPIVGKSEAKSFCELRRFAKSIDPKVKLLAHCRCHPEDIRQAMEAGFDGLNLYMGLSTQAQETYGKSYQEIMEVVVKTVAECRTKYKKKWLRFSGEDAFRTPTKRLFEVYDAVEEYVDVLGTPDTTGTARPEAVKRRIRTLKKRYPNKKIECHFHNDLGMALANSVAAIESGAEFIDTTIWGIGERSGITSVTGLLANLYEMDPGIREKYELNNCYPINVLLGSMLNKQVPFSEPVSLTNRTHIAGVHQKAMGKNGKTYEAHYLREFGVNREEMLLGPLSGWNFVYYYLKEIEGYEINEVEAKAIAGEFKQKTDKLDKKTKPEELLRKIADKQGLKRVQIPIEEKERRVEDF